MASSSPSSGVWVSPFSPSAGLLASSSPSSGVWVSPFSPSAGLLASSSPSSGVWVSPFSPSTGLLASSSPSSGVWVSSFSPSVDSSEFSALFPSSVDWLPSVSTSSSSDSVEVSLSFWVSLMLESSEPVSSVSAANAETFIRLRHSVRDRNTAKPRLHKFFQVLIHIFLSLRKLLGCKVSGGRAAIVGTGTA